MIKHPNYELSHYFVITSRSNVSFGIEVLCSFLNTLPHTTTTSVKIWDVVTLILSLLVSIDSEKLHTFLVKTPNPKKSKRIVSFFRLFICNICVLFCIVSPSHLHKSFQTYDLTLPGYLDYGLTLPGWYAFIEGFSLPWNIANSELRHITYISTDHRCSNNNNRWFP